MSTRANIIIKDKFDTMYFYRHSDGYPEGTMPLLKDFLSHVEKGNIRNNCVQAAGWLILLGHQEYLKYGSTYEIPSRGAMGWKVGSIEPTTEIHGDIEYIYTIDLIEQTITTKEV